MIAAQAEILISGGTFMEHLTPTPHNSAREGDFAKTVLMPGDPLRAKYIADTFLEDVTLVNNVRGIQGYTGFWKGKRVSVMASGMGIPSIGIYSYELYNFYGVESIIRIGSAGAIHPDLRLRDIVIGQGACTNSRFADQFGLPGTFAPIADFGLLEKAVAASRKAGVRFMVGNLLSSDVFYSDTPAGNAWEKMGVLAVEMESAGLYMNAARAGKKALCICTISDGAKIGACSAEERQLTFTQMMEIALEIA
jgi:purine-nucleoside phosphorylase